MEFRKSLFVLLVVGSALVFGSCSKDDDDDSSTSSSFTYDGKTYPLDKGFLLDLGPNLDGSHDFDAYLVSEDIEAGLLGFTGMGDGVYLDLNSSSDMDLVAGTYEFAADRAPFTIVSGSGAILDYNFTVDEGEEIFANGGSVVVKVNGDSYELEFNLETADGKNIQGSFKGALEKG